MRYNKKSVHLIIFLFKCLFRMRKERETRLRILASGSSKDKLIEVGIILTLR